MLLSAAYCELLIANRKQRYKFFGVSREKCTSLVLGFLVLVYNGLCTKVHVLDFFHCWILCILHVTPV